MRKQKKTPALKVARESEKSGGNEKGEWADLVDASYPTKMNDRGIHYLSQGGPYLDRPCNHKNRNQTRKSKER